MEDPPPLIGLIEECLLNAEYWGYKPSSVWYRLKEQHESGAIALTWADLAYIGMALEYHPAWAVYKAQEMGIL